MSLLDLESIVLERTPPKISIRGIPLVVSVFLVFFTYQAYNFGLPNFWIIATILVCRLSFRYRDFTSFLSIFTYFSGLLLILLLPLVDIDLTILFIIVFAVALISLTISIILYASNNLTRSFISVLLYIFIEKITAYILSVFDQPDVICMCYLQNSSIGVFIGKFFDIHLVSGFIILLIILLSRARSSYVILFSSMLFIINSDVRFLKSISIDQNATRTISISVVQPNFLDTDMQNWRNRSTSRDISFNTIESLMKKSSSADIYVLPEYSWPDVVFTNETSKQSKLFENKRVLYGATWARGSKRFNAAIDYNNRKNKIVTTKRYPIPFFETRFVDIGQDAKLVKLGSYNFSTVICYDVFAYKEYNMKDNFEIILSNTQGILATYYELNAAIYRSNINGIPIVFASNRGLSTLILPDFTYPSKLSRFNASLSTYLEIPIKKYDLPLFIRFVDKRGITHSKQEKK